MTRDRVEPGDRWEFDDAVADAFEDMLERSIPWYENMRAIVTEMAASFVPPAAGQVVDLGASRGDGLAPLIDRFEPHGAFWAVEVAPAMLEVLRERWPQEMPVRGIHVIDYDLRNGYPPVPAAHATLLVLTLQFIPIEYRQRILAHVYQRTVPGGALILVEKVLGATAGIDRLLVERYYALKGEHGYSQTDIERKRLSLEGVLVPVTAAWNEELLHQAGFQEVDCFWRWANFAGWVAVRS